MYFRGEKEVRFGLKQVTVFSDKPEGVRVREVIKGKVFVKKIVCQDFYSQRGPCK